MILPTLRAISQTRQMTDVFQGYNHNLRIGSGEWYEEENLSCRAFPLFAPRQSRGVVRTLSAPRGIFAKERLAYIDGESLYLNGDKVDGITLHQDAQTRQFVSMGAYLLIFPDGVYVNTQDLSDCGSIDATFTAPEGSSITYTLCRQDGTPYEIPEEAISDVAPEDPENGDYWIDTSGNLHILNQFSAQSAIWVQIPTVYIRVGCPGIGKCFQKGDGVTISGIQGSEQLEKVSLSQVLEAAEEDAIVITGMLDRVETQAGSITVSRKAPKMDFVVEQGNRLWGCRYGMTDGKMLNEIYACSLGDFKNWNVFRGISTDSYIASIGTDGPFTGAVNYMGRLIFFKESCMHQVSGTAPSSFQVSSIPCRGVENGSGASLAIVSEVLFYKSREGVCSYDGSIPQSIASSFGEETYSHGVGGSFQGRYYLSMKDWDNAWHLFVYDVRRGIWHREDSLCILGFAAVGTELYAIDRQTGKLLAMTGQEGEKEGPVPWQAVSGVIGYEYPDQKYVSRLVLRMKMAKGSRMRLSIQYDSEGDFEDQGGFQADHGELSSFTFPVIPRRCDHLRLKLEGVGDVRIFSVCRILEQGGDIA